MAPLTAESLLSFANDLEGERLNTLSRAAGFTLRVLPTGIEITPGSSGQPRVVSREIVQRVCEEFQRTRSMRPSDYHSMTFDSSYLIAVIDRYIRQG